MYCFYVNFFTSNIKKHPNNQFPNSKIKLKEFQQKEIWLHMDIYYAWTAHNNVNNILVYIQRNIIDNTLSFQFTFQCTDEYLGILFLKQLLLC